MNDGREGVAERMAVEGVKCCIAFLLFEACFLSDFLDAFSTMHACICHAPSFVASHDEQSVHNSYIHTPYIYTYIAPACVLTRLSV